MLFDLQGKRRNVIRVSYTILAVIFVGGFVFLGIGGEVQSGLGSLFGFDSNNPGQGDTRSTFSTQVEEAEEALAANPDDPEAMLAVARYSYLEGAQLLTRVPGEEEGQETLETTPETEISWNRALDAWSEYVATNPSSIEVPVAGQMVYAARMMENAVAAAEIQQLIVDEEPTEIGFRDLALFLYAQGNIEEGRAAADQAVELAPDEEKEEAKEWRRELHKQSVQYQKALQAFEQSGGEQQPSQLPNPFGSLGQEPGQLPSGFGQ